MYATGTLLRYINTLGRRGIGYKVEQIEELKKVLAALPKLRPNVAKLKTIDALRLLREEIDRMQHKGYALDAIAAILGQHGLRMNGKTLRNYLAKIRLDPPHTANKQPLPLSATEWHHEPDIKPSPLTLLALTKVRVEMSKKAATNPRNAGGFALHPDTEDL